jgi:phosphoglycerate kinase
MEHETMAKIVTVSDLDVANKRALVRVDFNVPMDKEGRITDDTRIVASLPTIKYIIENKGKAILVSHLGRPKGISPEFTLAPCAKRLSELLQQPVKMASDCIGSQVHAQVLAMKPGEVLLLENVRFYPAEEKPDFDPTFAEKLAALADLYVNDAFGTAHRAHSSTTTVAKYFPGKSAAGFLLEKEINFLGSALKDPKRPFIAIIGGAKVSTKIGVLQALCKKVDALLIGGGMAYTFLKAQGISIGDSLVENEMLETAKEILQSGCKIYLPRDIVAATAFHPDATRKSFDIPEGIPAGYQGMDIGEKTLKEWSELVKQAKTILWNGPVGVFEMKPFAKGTLGLANAISEVKGAITIVGGGDTVAAIQEAGLTDRFTHVSTGGGASLEYVEFGTLPGIDALSTS